MTHSQLLSFTVTKALWIEKKKKKRKKKEEKKRKEKNKERNKE